MIQLTAEYWSEFQPDGILFEDLVGALLALEYPGKTFKHTQASHDGNRDWELEIPLLDGASSNIWFECKFHGKPLAPEKVAMTLVMAYIEAAQQIIFFSYSPVNSGFVKKISRFSERSKIPVRIYDDTALESLIIRHWNSLDTKRFFPGKKPSKAAVPNDTLSVYCEVYKNGASIACHKSDELPVIRFNDEIMLRISLINRNSDADLPVRISLNRFDCASFLICDDAFSSAQYQKVIFVPHNGVSSFSLNLKLKRFGPKIVLPSVFIQWETEEKVIRPGAVEGRWLAETSLIGTAFHDAVFMQTQCMKSNSFTVSQIVGHSGVGKSRLLHEVVVQCHVLGKETFLLDNDFQKNDYITFIRKLVSMLDGLPVLPSVSKVIYNFDESDKDRGIAIQILYDDKFLSEISDSKLARFLFTRMKVNNVWLLLDNVQWMDERSLKLLETLISYAGETSSAGILLSFNQDYVYSGTVSYQLLKCISAYSAQHPEKYQSVDIEGFTYQDALTYLHECLTYQPEDNTDDLDYDLTLKKVVDHCGTQPFYLQNMLLYLNQQQVLLRTEKTCFFIASISDFWKHVREIPKTVTALLERRILSAEKYFKEIGEDAVFNSLCAVLSFTGSIPPVLIRELFGTFSIKRQLLDLGLLCVDETGSVTFFHQYFEQYFRETTPINQLPSELLEQFSTAVRKRRLKKTMLAPYYLAQYALGTCDQTLLETVARKISEWKIPPRLSRAVIKAIYTQLENESEYLDGKLVANCYYAICFMTANRNGMNEACYYYEHCYQDLLENKKAYTKYREILFPLVREYLLSLGNLNRNHEAIEKAKALLPCQISDYEYCTIYEILCISNYSMGQTDEACAAIQNALQHCSQDEINYVGLIQELGKAYYYHPDAYRYRELICAQWDHAFSIYQSKWEASLDLNELNSKQKDIAAYLNAGISDLIHGRMAEAETKVSHLSNYLDHTEMPFYEIKIRLFRAMVLLQHDITEQRYGYSHKEICSLLDQACDICVIYYNMQDYPLCFYLRASAQLFAGQYAEAADSYIKTCTVIQRCVDNEYEESIWSYFYEDMALRFSQLHMEFPPELLAGIHAKKLQERVKKLMRSGQQEDALSQCGRSPILWGVGPWGLPKI